MTIRQLSVFMENKPGNLNDILLVLAQNNINIAALTVADTSDYGILRLLVSDPQKALDKLREKHFTVRIHDVLSLEMDPEPGSLYRILHHFAEAAISMEYVYAFSFTPTTPRSWSGQRSAATTRPPRSMSSSATRRSAARA